MNQIEESNNAIKNTIQINNATENSLKSLEVLTKRSRFTLFIASLALFFTVIGIAAGYKNWMQINERAKQALMRVSKLEQQANHFADKSTVIAFNQQLLHDFDKSREQFKQSVEVLEAVKKVTQRASKNVEQQAVLLTQQQEKLRAKAPSPNTQWRLAELRFLLRTATERLQLHKDKDGALQALIMAESVLLKLGSRKYLPVREEINQEIVFLESFLTPNITAISEHIADLMQIVDAIPVTNSTLKQEKITLLPKPSTEENGLFVDIVNGINNAVVIHKFDPSIQKIMGADEKEKLKNLLHLRFETLRLMALQRLDYDYHQQLKLIKQSLEKYYPDMINDSLQKGLDELDNVDLSPTPPDISASLKLLDQISKAKVRK